VYSTVKLARVLFVIVYWLEKSGVAAVRVTCAVPEPLNVPAPLTISAAAGWKVAPEPMANEVTAEKLPVPVTVPAAVMLNVWKASVPLLEIDPPAVLNVIVPPVGERLAPEFTVSALLTVKLPAGWVVGVPAMVKL
jgi:hypothetical protein